MRNIFLVGAKLLGIFYCFWAISLLPQIIAGFRSLYSTSQADQVEGMWGFIISLFIALGINIFLGIVLIFCTNRIASILSIPKNDLQSDVTFSQYLRIGIILIGIYTLTLGVPEILGSLVQMKKLQVLTFSFATKQLVSSVVKVAIGSYLAFYSNKIVNMLSR